MSKDIISIIVPCHNEEEMVPIFHKEIAAVSDQLPAATIELIFVNDGSEGDTLAKMLFGYGLLQLLFMLRLMPWYLSQPFNASFWSFSFGVSALATTGLHLGCGSDNGFFHTLAVPLFIFTNFIIAILLIRTFALLMQGKLLVRTERAVLMKAEDKE